MEISNKIKRYFTADKLDFGSDSSAKAFSVNSPVYDLFEWKKVDVLITNYKTGEPLINMKDLEFPEHFSQNACDIIAGKYFRKKRLSLSK